MGYFIRVLTPSRARVSAATIRGWLKDVREVGVRFSRPRANWARAMVSPRDQPDIGVLSIERNTRSSSHSLVSDELAEFDEELKRALPRSGAKWVRSFLGTVKTIYAIQLHSAASEHPTVIGAIVEGLRGATGGIVQADGNGFSNENGDLVVWQFSENATGEWTVAVLTSNGSWNPFQLDLSDERARAAFLRGNRPAFDERKGRAARRR